MDPYDWRVVKTIFGLTLGPLCFILGFYVFDTMVEQWFSLPLTLITLGCAIGTACWALWLIEMAPH